MSQFKTTTIEDTEMIYSLLRDKYPDRQIEIEFNDNTKEYFLKLTNEKFKEDPEVPVDIKIKIIYGDSVTGDTPVLLKKDDNIYIETIQSIFEESKKFEYPGFKLFDKTIRLEKEYCLSDYQIWSDIGWVDIKKVIRHKTDKKIYNVLTHNGFVKVTEDHSLLNENGDIIKPSECNLETKLLSNYPTQFDCNIETISKDRAYIYGFFYGDGSCDKYDCPSGLKYTSWALNNSDLNIIENLKQLLTKEYPEHTPIVYDTIESSGVYKLSVNNQKLFVEEYRSKFYDSDRYKKVPSEILNSSLEVVQSFFEGYKLTSDFENNFSEDDEDDDDDDDEDEEWRVIKEFPQYLASSLGNIKHIETNKLRTLKANNGGYITIGINNNDNIRKQVKVHRLIADTFLDNVENKETVNHINHNKLDNRVKNLEWATTKEQNNHKSHNQINSNNSKKVLQYDLDGNFIKEYNSIKEIGRIFNKNPGDISKICNNLKGFKTFEGYTWKFKDEDNILENEIWKTIKIDNHIFNVSNFGRVKSKNNIISYGSLSTNGYMRVTSQEDKVSKRMYVHRLVATTFIENKLNNKDQVVNHMDGNKQNNNVNNLEWITYQENSKHSFDLKATDGCRKDKEKIGCTRFDNKGQIGSAGLYYLMRKLGYNVSINTREDKEKILRLTITQKQQRKIPNQIKKIKISNHDSYVYDIETECGRFQAGVGDIIVKNTDSIFISLKYNREEFNKNRADTFNLATICGENITKMFNRNPIDLEFEKVFQPFILLTKKRYIGKKYENMKDPFKLKEITKSGIAITRRDYCKMVKNCYTEVIDCIVNEDGGGVNNSVEIYKSYVDRIDNYQIDIDDLIVSAMLAKSYKTRPVHVQLAEKLKARHEEVQVGSRIPYIFIESADKTLAKSELGEDPIYAKKHNLKYNRKCYLEQMAKPLLGFFKCVLSDNEEALDDIINYTNEKLVEYGGAKLKPSDFKMKEDD